jgi:hypothetical protein
MQYSYMPALVFASTYSSVDYNTSTYNREATTSSGTSGSLADSGTAAVAFVTIAVIIIVVAILIRMTRRKKTILPPPPTTGTVETIDGEHPKIKVQ